MTDIVLVHTYMCAICSNRFEETYKQNDPHPETSICPECDKRFDKIKLSWESNVE